MDDELPFQQYEYVVWFRDPRMLPDDQDYEWPAVCVVEASSAEKAQAWGDRAARVYAANTGESFLHSSVKLRQGPPGRDKLPVLTYGVEPGDAMWS